MAMKSRKWISKAHFLNDNLEKNIYMSQLEGFIGIRFGAKDLHLWVKPGN